MRVLIVTEFFPNSQSLTITGGVEARAWFLSRGLARRHQVSVITSFQIGSQRYETLDGVRVHRVGSHHEYANEGKVLSRLRFAFAAQRKGLALGNFDVVDGYNFVSYLPAYSIARKIGGIAVATYHEVWCGSWVKAKGIRVGLLGEIWERLALALEWDQYVAVSNSTAQSLIARGVSQQRIAIVRNGVNTGEIGKVVAGKRKETSICMVSRLTSSKQPQLLLQALAIIAQSHPSLMKHLEVQICGDGPMLEPCKKMARSLGIFEHVAFLGRLEHHTDVFRLMKESSLLVLPSQFEGFGIVLAEASACGTPFLASDIPTCREIQKILGGGQSFRPGSAQHLAEQIIQHFSGQPIALGRSENLDWGTICEELESCYENVLLKRGIL